MTGASSEMTGASVEMRVPLTQSFRLEWRSHAMEKSRSREGVGSRSLRFGRDDGCQGCSVGRDELC